MRLLLTEKIIKIKKDFQKLLDNSIQIYGESKEKIVLISNNMILYKEVNFLYKKQQYTIDYHCYLFLDTEKPYYQDRDCINYAYDCLSRRNNLYKSWMKPEPFFNNMRTDYNSYDILSLLFLSFSYSDTISQEVFSSKQEYISESMESNMLSYTTKTMLVFEGLVKEMYYTY
tara:strand:- start:943 stop:1458 length:516 start_codon:yes stop_codon:yes gene_type:complete